MKLSLPTMSYATQFIFMALILTVGAAAIGHSATVKKWLGIGQ